LIESDRLTEILCFKTWRINILEQQYKAFVADCLDRSELTEIISFADWEKASIGALRS
jgi:hypothetical protein